MHIYERKMNVQKTTVLQKLTCRFDGGSVRMWGATSYNKRTPLVLVSDNCFVTRSYSLIFSQSSTRRERFFSTTMPDRTTARVNVDFLACHNVTVIPWTSRSPDLNPMDHLWDRFDKRVCMHQPARKLFCKSSRHYKNNGKEHPRSKFNV